MPSDVFVLLVLFFAALVRSTVGFGDALLSVPLLTLLIGLDNAAPLVGLISVSTALLMSGLSWRKMDVRSVLPLLAAAVVGIPVGVFFLRNVRGAWLIHVLGVFLALFGVYRLLRPNVPGVTHPALAPVLGFVAGMFGGAFNISGPFAVLYGSLRRWPPEVFRASLQGYFIVTSLTIAASQGIAGLWTTRTWTLYAFALPLTFTAIFIGNVLARRVPSERLERFISVAVVVLGVTLVI